MHWSWNPGQPHGQAQDPSRHDRFLEPLIFTEEFAEAEGDRKCQCTADCCVDNDRYDICTDQVDIESCHRREDNDLK